MSISSAAEDRLARHLACIGAEEMPGGSVQGRCDNEGRRRSHRLFAHVQDEARDHARDQHAADVHEDLDGGASVRRVQANLVQGDGQDGADGGRREDDHHQRQGDGEDFVPRHVEREAAHQRDQREDHRQARADRHLVEQDLHDRRLFLGIAAGRRDGQLPDDLHCALATSVAAGADQHGEEEEDGGVHACQRCKVLQDHGGRRLQQEEEDEAGRSRGDGRLGEALHVRLRQPQRLDELALAHILGPLVRRRDRGAVLLLGQGLVLLLPLPLALIV
mmetsp:Transcript_73396/g.192450  ORF Transcript_73396/g.192450 Transcript_73396/m.192450 type:complete len:276 (+) Transcript_73396:50-877(+)